MSFRTLRTFRAIGRCGSFAAAARQLGLTQSAVSMQIRALEEHVGTDLFDRSHHRPRLNSAGRLVLERVEDLLDAYDRLGDGLGGQAVPDGPLRIGSIQTALVEVMPLVLRRVQSDYPGIRPTVLTGLSAELVARLDQGEFDMVVVTEPPSPPPQWLEFTRVRQEQFYVLAPAGHPEPPLADGPEDARWLRSLPYLQFDRSAWAGQQLDAVMRQRGLDVQATMQFDSLTAALVMVEAGLGVSVAPLSVQRVQAVQGRVRLIPFGDPPMMRHVGVMQRRDHPRQQAVAVVTGILRQLEADLQKN